jgi:predicted RNA-binding protein with PIN domain
VPSSRVLRQKDVALRMVRWIVDGMNVIGTRPDAWWKDRHAAMVQLVDLLERWSAAHGDEVLVVFEQPPSPPISSTTIEVAHAPRPRRDSADDEIVRRLTADPDPGAIRVVTSDHFLADRARAVGAGVEPAGPFRTLLESV